jgi:hypothetical protein
MSVNVKPYVYSVSGAKSILPNSTSTIRIQLSASSTDFSVSDISINGGSLTSFSGSNNIYSVTVTPVSVATQGIILSIASGSYHDLDGNPNDESFSLALANGTLTLNGIQNLISGTSGSDYIDGTSNNDHIDTLGGNDYVLAGDGNDEINGRPSLDRADPYLTNSYTGTLLVYLGAGDDFIYGGDKSDEVYGEDGNDDIWGVEGNDFLSGGSGVDYIFGGVGNDTLVGGDGDDVLYDGQGNNLFYGGNGNDVLNGLWNSIGDSGLQSKYFGEAGNDTLYGSKGNDQLTGGAGDDWIDGGWGGTSDTAYYAGNFSQFTVTAINDNSGPFEGKFRVVDLTGTEGTDTISGTVEFLNFNNGKTIVTLNNGSYTYKTLNSSPTGTIKIIGNQGVGSTLNVTNTISDEDGIGSIKFQWLSSLDGKNWKEIGLGTSFLVDLNAAGNFLKVTAIYTDSLGIIESVSSEQTNRIPDLIRKNTNNISLIVDMGVLEENAVLLKDLLEIKVWKNNKLFSHTIQYKDTSYNYKDFELLVSIVTRNGDFTDEFKFEIDNYLQRDAHLTYDSAVEIVGLNNIDQSILKIAGSDGNFVG